MQVTISRTADLTPERLAEIRALCDAAFGDGFSEQDWQHSLGGDHILGYTGEVLSGQAAVVPRVMRCGGKAWRTGYVEAVAVHPDAQGRGVGRELMLAANRLIAAHYELGALSAGERAARLYQGVGWLRWSGPTFVDSPEGTVATPEEDGSVYILPLVEMDLAGPIVCDWRDGDVW